MVTGMTPDPSPDEPADALTASLVALLIEIGGAQQFLRMDGQLVADSSECRVNDTADELAPTRAGQAGHPGPRTGHRRPDTQARDSRTDIGLRPRGIA
ncbi:hypothetical protein TL10_26125 [Mycolicibacterium llatzerense]|uniref:Uncharacterized protein n=1 Tax=Mycolicibacterium llatzerense TaxID=280871 RepID=A0A0D1IXS2_9MYCO|nr:hypothetical protein TL10_26125 [Mycolicibacterium llatzerense]